MSFMRGSALLHISYSRVHIERKYSFFKTMTCIDVLGVMFPVYMHIVLYGFIKEFVLVTTKLIPFFMLLHTYIPIICNTENLDPYFPTFSSFWLCLILKQIYFIKLEILNWQKFSFLIDWII